MTENKQIEEILYQLITDFNNKWSTGSELHNGIREYADKIIKQIDFNKSWK